MAIHKLIFKGDEAVILPLKNVNIIHQRTVTIQNDFTANPTSRLRMQVGWSKSSGNNGRYKISILDKNGVVKLAHSGPLNSFGSIIASSVFGTTDPFSVVGMNVFGDQATFLTGLFRMEMEGLFIMIMKEYL